MERNKIIEYNVTHAPWPLEDNSVDCCVTSPPYWGLRNYGVTGQLGLEKTPEEFIANMVAVFQEVRRVLKPEGTLWLNIGDSYASNSKNRTKAQATNKTGLQGSTDTQASILQQQNKIVGDLKPKDLVGIPWLLAFALRSAGWYLRQDIIWHKPNPMPESVTDRCTKSHEYIFMLSKSERYYYDAYSIRTPYADKTYTTFGAQSNGHGDASGLIQSENWAKDVKVHKPKVWKTPDGWDTKPGAHGNIHREGREKGETAKDKQRGHSRRHAGFNDRWDKMTVKEQQEMGANKRSVWTVSTIGFPEAHFACVDADTECLTDGGWKRYNEITKEDQILTYNSAKELEYQKLNDIYLYDAHVDLIVIKGRDLDIKMTKNHRCVVLSRNREGYVELIKLAENLNTRDSIRVSANFKNNFSSALTKDHYRLLGWFLAEGYMDKYKSSIYQNSGEKADEIRELLVSEGIEFVEAKRSRTKNEEIDFRIKQKSSSYFRAHFVSAFGYNKIPNRKILFAEEEKLQALFESLIKADGHKRRDGRNCFIQKNKRVIDFVQELCVLLGKRTFLSKRKEGTFCLYITDKKYIGLRKTNGVGISKTTEHYNGVVWCPNTDNATFVARRNGNVFITGNTFPEELITPCILAGSPKGGLILDPFMGAGTTALVAMSHGRDFIGLELNPEYITIAESRLKQKFGMFYKP